MVVAGAEYRAPVSRGRRHVARHSRRTGGHADGSGRGRGCGTGFRTGTFQHRTFSHPKGSPMAKEDREMRRLQASVRSLQGALATIAGEIESIGATGKTVGLDQAKAKIDEIREQIGDLVTGQIERAEEVGESVRRSVVENPFTAMSAAFVAGLAAAVLLGARR
ncbi:MAG: hypothetical protein IT561_16100 [Alphaproteobacteria bacterium]|nr:hypothetical protein [Alphaproteobacteria bacterium]